MDKKIFKCRLCGMSDYKTIFFTDTPLSGKYSIIGEESDKYPLHVVFCKNCGHVQLANEISVNFYENYLYTPSYSNEFQNYIKNFVSRIDDEYKNCTDKKIIEIGSGNGALLKNFKDKNWKVLGIEPSKTLADESNKNGVDTLNDYFDENSLEKINELIGVPDVIIMRHVLEHLNNLSALISVLAECIYPKSHYNAPSEPNGGGYCKSIYIEVPYVKKIIEEKQFYAFYHEHVSYFSVKSLKYLLESANFKIVDIEENKLEGGSLLIKAIYDKEKFSSEVPKLDFYLKEEGKFISPKSLEKFSINIKNFINDFKEKIKYFRKNNQIVAGWGAGQRAFTLMNLCELTKQDIAYIIDVNQNYWWKYINGTEIQIVPPDYYKNHHADKIIIFATGYAEEIIAGNSDFTKSGGEFLKII